MADTRNMGGTIGLHTARFGILKDDGTVDTTFGENGIFTVDAVTDGGVSKATISGLAPSQTEIYGNDTLVDVSTGEAKPSIALQTNFMDREIINRLLGRTKMPDGSYTLDGDPNQRVAVDLITTDKNNKLVHFGFYRCSVTQGDVDLGTNNDNQTRVVDDLTLKAITTVRNGQNVMGKIGAEVNTDFKQADFDADLFPTAGAVKATNSFMAKTADKK